MPSRAMSELEAMGEIYADPPRNRRLLASGILLVCIAFFVTQSELAQFVQNEMHFNKPYFLLYIVHSFYVVMIPLQLFFETVVLSKENKSPRDYNLAFQRSQQQFSISLHDLVITQSRLRHNGHVLLPVDEEEADTTIPFHFSHVRYLIKLAIMLAVLITFPAYLWYTCVNLISMPNLTIIYNTSCFFAYVFSVWLLGENVVWQKILAVVLSIAGVAIIAFWDLQDPADGTSEEPERKYIFLGNMLTVIAAAAYGFYEVFYKKHATPPIPSIRFANILTGCIGLATFLLLWIPIPILNIVGFETFSLPDLMTSFYILLIALCGVGFSASFMCIIALTSPVLAAVGIMLTIPIVAFADWVVTGIPVTWNTIIGTLFVISGFVLLIRDDMGMKVEIPLADEEDLAD